MKNNKKDHTGWLDFEREPGLRCRRRVDRAPVHRRSSRVPHLARPDVRGPAHIVLRIRRGLPSLRTPRAYRVLEHCFRLGKSKQGFRLIHFSVQQDHLHLVVEAEGKRKLARAMQGLMIRIAKSLNRFWRRRLGAVFADRYFALAVTSYKQAWRTVRYVLGNGRKHGVWLSNDQPDPFSSGRWFRWWSNARNICRPLRRAPVETAGTLLLEYLPPIPVDHTPGVQPYDDGETMESLINV